MAGKHNEITVVAMLKHEDNFVAEWVAYHRLIGVDRFLLYDNDPNGPLKKIFRHEPDVTVVRWPDDKAADGFRKQDMAYKDAFSRATTEWIALLDGDEFVSLTQHRTLNRYLAEFDRSVGAVTLSWHLFGHNGYFEDPPGLITAALTRRRRSARHSWAEIKSITRVKAILALGDWACHWLELQPGYTRVDGNQLPYAVGLDYPGRTARAHINHYFCRSFQNWMKRVERGDGIWTKAKHPSVVHWRFDPDLCLRRFVEDVRDTNELVDDEMLRFSKKITAEITAMRQRRRQKKAR